VALDDRKLTQNYSKTVGLGNAGRMAGLAAEALREERMEARPIE
jgi:hypothetical protein